MGGVHPRCEYTWTGGSGLAAVGPVDWALGQWEVTETVQVGEEGGCGASGTPGFGHIYYKWHHQCSRWQAVGVTAPSYFGLGQWQVDFAQLWKGRSGEMGYLSGFGGAEVGAKR